MLFRSLKLTWQRDLMLVHMIRQHLCQCIFALPRRAIKSYDIHIRESPNKCAIKLKTRNPTKNRQEENRPWWGRCSPRGTRRSEEHTSELQSLMRISYAVFCLKKKTNYTIQRNIKKQLQRYEDKH